MTPSTEKKLFLLCARKTMTGSESGQLRQLLAQNLNWKEIVDTADSQGIAPLLYTNLKHFRDYDLIPEEIMNRLREAYFDNLARNMYLYSELQQIVQALDARDVDVVILKGAALAGVIYSDIGLRPMVDVDILVRHESLSVVNQIMYDLNYKSQTEIKSEQWYRENHYHLPVFLHNEKSIAVEVHWHITENADGIDINKWWDRALRTQLQGMSILIPAPEDMLLHLCLHLFHDNYNSKTALRGLCDITGILQYFSKEMKWELFHDNVMRSGFAKVIYASLFIVNKYLYSNDEIVASYRNKLVDMKFVAVLERSLFGSEYATYAPFINSLSADTFWKRARLSYSRIFPSRTEMSDQYSLPPHSGKIYFYYVYRPFELAVKYGRSLMDLLRLKHTSE